VKLAILSRAPRSYSTRRLRQAAQARGHRAKVFDTRRFSIDIRPEQPDLYYGGVRLTQYDAVLPRIGASMVYYGAAVVRQFEQMDIYTANSSLGIANACDRLRSLQAISKHRIGIPATTFVKNVGDARDAIERIGGPPVVIKLSDSVERSASAEGDGVILAKTAKVAEAIIEALHHSQQHVLLQEFVDTSGGRDLRALVVGDRVVAAIRHTGGRRASSGHVMQHGNHVESVDLDDSCIDTAVRSTQILGLRIATVDMLEGVAGPHVLAVHSAPALEPIEMVTKLDVAGAIIDFLAAQVDFPELDLRQRLTVSRGYGVVEMYLPEGSEMIGQNLGEAGFQQREINVLTLQRGTAVTPNPPSTRRLEAGDRLLCYGRFESMRELIPAYAIAARRPPVQHLKPVPLGS
jgi:ribosomal protein S6--L-glutamate ligase